MARSASKSAQSTSETAPAIALSHKDALLSTTIEQQPVSVTEAVKKAITKSDEQLAILHEIKTGTGNWVVRARAGTGKTYLLLEAVPLMFGEIALVAYNRKAANQLQRKLTEAGLNLRQWNEIRAQRAGTD